MLLITKATLVLDEHPYQRVTLVTGDAAQEVIWGQITDAYPENAPKRVIFRVSKKGIPKKGDLEAFFREAIWRVWF